MSTNVIVGFVIGFFGIMLGSVFMYVLATPMLDAAVASLTHASIGSFTGATGIGGLGPMVYFTIGILAMLGGIGAIGFSGYRAIREG